MISLDEAQSYVWGLGRPLSPRDVPVGQAVGLVLPADVVSTEDIPGFDNSAVDGFAVRSVDDAGAGLRIVGRQMAGVRLDLTVGAGETVQIMTGAPMPAGADAVVMVERTRVVDGTMFLDGGEPPLAGAGVRRAGEDMRAGDVALAAGLRLRPAGIGVLASLGRAVVSVVPAPVVGVLSTGDELVVGGGSLAPGQIRDSNRPALLSAVAGCGAVAVDLGHVGDDEAAVQERLADAVSRCDVVVTSGGVSMGEADVIKAVLRRRADMRWMQVAIRPAKPLAAGRWGDAVVVGLPGNPVSSLVSFELFVRPLLGVMAGRGPSGAVEVRARAGASFSRRADGKVHFVRALLTPGSGGVEPVVIPASGQGSHQQSAMARADALVRLDDGTGVEAGEMVTALLL